MVDAMETFVADDGLHTAPFPVPHSRFEPFTPTESFNASTTRKSLCVSTNRARPAMTA